MTRSCPLSSAHAAVSVFCFLVDRAPTSPIGKIPSLVDCLRYFSSLLSAWLILGFPLIAHGQAAAAGCFLTPCAPGCPAFCDPILCFTNSLCDTSCGGDPCTFGCGPFTGTGLCSPGCSGWDDCDSVLCPLNLLCNPACGGDACNFGCNLVGVGPCSPGCPFECNEFLCPLNYCEPQCFPECKLLCGGDPCASGCTNSILGSSECHPALCPENYCSEACGNAQCKPLCGGDPCKLGCPDFCSPVCISLGGGPCGTGCEDECSELCPQNLLCRVKCGGNPKNPDCDKGDVGPNPCDIEDSRCDPLLCPFNHLCDPACGGMDCDGQGYADQCNITLCRSFLPVMGGCDDCNLNFIPDQCDIDNGTSLDVNRNGIPDECCLISVLFGGGLFSDRLCSDSVTIDMDAAALSVTGTTAAEQLVVTVDAAASVKTLRLYNGAVMAVTGIVDEDLTVITAGGITVSGRKGNPSAASCLFVANDRVVDATLGQVLIDAGGEYRKDPADDTGSSASLLAGGLIINSGSFSSIRNGGRFELTDTMSATIGGDFLMDGAAVDFAVQVTNGIANSDRAAQLGITPSPKLTVDLDALLSVAGAFRMRKEAEVCIDCESTAGGQQAVVSVAGDFDNQSSAPGLFDWTHGVLMLSGSHEQVFEVAGVDGGAIREGQFMNFAMGTIEVGPMSSVRFMNNFANTAGAGDCAEALYVHRLVLAAGSTVTLDNVRVFYDELVDNGATIDLLGSCAAQSPILNGDSDGNDVVNLLDYVNFTDCMNGPGQSSSPTLPTTPQQCAEYFDFDIDLDVDLRDFGPIQRYFGGS